jgi:putative NADH-flavin reductase
MNVILETGALGMTVMRELVARGEPVKMVSLRGKATVPSGVKVEQADLMNKDQSKAIMQQAKVVFQCAQPPYEKWHELFLPFQEHIVSGAIAAGARLVVAENLYMYDASHIVIRQLRDAGKSRRVWEKFSAGGESQNCGWIKDKYRLSWQIISAALSKMLQDKDAEKSKKVMEAMLKMDKIDIKALKQAYGS